MDTSDIRNRVISSILSGLAAAAITTTFLYMFQDSSDVDKTQKLKEKKVQAASASKNLNGPIARGIPNVGEATILFPDFLKGLETLGNNARQRSIQGLGWFDNFGKPTLVIANPQHAKLCLDKTTAHALWGGIKTASEAFFGKSVLFVLEGAEWRRLRGIIRDSFKLTRIEVLSRSVSSCALSLSNRLQQFADSGAVIDMNNLLSQYHLAAIGKCSFDYDLDAMNNFPNPSEMSNAFEYLLQELPRRSFSPDEKVREDYTSATEDNIKWQKAAKTVRAIVSSTIQLRLQEERDNPRYESKGDFLDAMIASYRTQNEIDSKDISVVTEVLTDVLGDNLVEMFFAGLGTSVVAICVALYYLSKDKKLLQQAQEEVDEVIPEEIHMGTNFTSKNFPFLSRVFMESLRIAGPTPLIARLTTEDLNFDDIKVPSGTNVWIPSIFLHKDPQAWGSSVDKFDPSRWEKPIVPGSFLPFSAGGRDCIGRHFAELESVVVLAVLLKTYEFDVAPGYEFMPMFTGFGTRIGDGKTMKIGLSLIPKRRTDVSTFMYDWTPQKISRKNSNPLFYGEDDSIPTPPKFH